jgi:hypothetical protein
MAAQGNTLFFQPVVECLLLDFPTQQRFLRLRLGQFVFQIGRYEYGQDFTGPYGLPVVRRGCAPRQIARLG